MAGFKCKHCGFDLSLRIDLLARALKADHQDKKFPSDIAIDGCCGDCKKPFTFSGEMFSKFLALKIEEGIIDPRSERFAIIEFDIGREEADDFKRLLNEGNKKELQAFLTKLMRREERPDEDD